jgi:cytochrome bd-type quinol oxidase subunit 1
MLWLRRLSLVGAYAITLLLSAVWVLSALAALRRPLFDLGKAGVGDAIIGFASCLWLSPQQTLKLAHMLVGVRLLLGALLLAAIATAIWNAVRRRQDGDAMLDVGLFLSAVASVVAGVPVMGESEPLQRLIGELMLCAIASGLAAFGRGYFCSRKPSTVSAYSWGCSMLERWAASRIVSAAPGMRLRMSSAASTFVAGS